MPFEQKYDTTTREAATSSVIERLTANPKDRTAYRAVAEEFNVGQQSLRSWVKKASPETVAAAPKRRPKFSPVVTTQPAAVTPESPTDAATSTAAVAPAPAAPAAAQSDDRIAELEDEVATLRRSNGILKDAMRVLLDA